MMPTHVSSRDEKIREQENEKRKEKKKMKRNTLKALKAYEAASKKARELKEETKTAGIKDLSIYEAERIARAALPFYLDNLKVAIFKDYIPDVCEIINKYAGKRYGEKTKAAIYNEIKSGLGVGSWIDHNGKEINLYLLNNQGYTYYFKAEINAYLKDYSKKIINDDNIIQVITADDLKQPDTIKKTSPEKAAARMIKELYKLEKHEKAFHELINKFNDEFKPSQYDSVWAGYMKRFYI